MRIWLNCSKWYGGGVHKNQVINDGLLLLNSDDKLKLLQNCNVFMCYEVYLYLHFIMHAVQFYEIDIQMLLKKRFNK